MSIIKPSICTNFPIGTKVKITNQGRSFTSYQAMHKHFGITQLGFNPFHNGEIGSVVGKAMHESESYGELLAVRVLGGVGIIDVTGVTHYEEPVVIAKPKLAQYDLAPITPEAFPELSPYFAKAPSWATHVGSDNQGVHFFDHHPHIFSDYSGAFLKGMLPNTHRAKITMDKVGATSSLKVLVIGRVPQVIEPTVATLKAELATVKAKLWEAEQKLKKVVEVAS